MAISTFLGLKYILPVAYEQETDEVARDTLTGDRVTTKGGMSRFRMLIRFKDDVRGKHNVEALLGAHIDQFGLSDDFEMQVPQPLGLVLPGAPIRLVTNRQYNANQTVIGVTTTTQTVIPVGLRFTLNVPDYDKMHRVVVGRTGQGTITIRPGLRADILGAAGQTFIINPVLARMYHGSLDPVRVGTTGVDQQYEFIESTP